jgi:death on curing protein
MVTLAVALMLGIARNHPFEQGNKRTGFIAAGMFLKMNGYRILPKRDSNKLGAIMEAVIEDRMSEEDFVEMIRLNVAPIKRKR